MGDGKAQRWRMDRWPALLLIACAASVLAFFAGQRAEPRIGDILLSALHVWHDAPGNIVIVAIDEDTLSHLPYRSPIDRAFLADLLSRLDKAGPKVIGVDILIDQPSEPAKDRRLIDTVAAAKTPIVMGAATLEDGLTEKQARFLAQALTKLDQGLVTLLRDKSDGTVRNVSKGRAVEGTWRPALAARMFEHIEPGRQLPAGRITYFSKPDGSPHSFPVYPAHAAQHLPDDWFEGKAVFVGAMIPTEDLHRTPFIAAVGAEKGLIHGMRIHAHMLAQFIAGNRLATFPPLAAFGFTLLFGLLATVIFKVARGPVWRLAGVSAVVCLLWAVGIFAFRDGNLHIPLAAPSIAALIVAAFLTVRHWYRDRAERDFIEKAFSQYVSPGLAKRIVAAETAPKLGGEKRLVTYVFTDLENFTGLAESLDPEAMATLLNDYLDQMCELFIQADATIDKIVGDAVVGFFGAPETQADQAPKAIALALAIDRFSESYREKAAENGISLGVTRIGIHRGEAVIGNFGGSRFFDYTGIGDTVNTAARLEAANRLTGTRICVSGAVAEAAPDVTFRPIGTIMLKGKREETQCFEPLPDAYDATLLDAYQNAFERMRAGDDGALRAFETIADRVPDDRLVRFHLERLRHGETGIAFAQTAK